MAIVHIQEMAKPIAVAMEWHSLTGTKGERQEIAEIAKSSGSKTGCLVADDESGASVLGVSHDQKPGVACGAAWLAKASAREPLILVEPLNTGKVWICGVKGGTPLQDRDVIIDYENLDEVLQGFLQDIVDARICSTIDGLEQNFDNVSPQGFAELVANIKQERLTRIQGQSPVLVAAIFFGLIGIGAYYGYASWQTTIEQGKNKIKLQQLSIQDAAKKEAEARRQAELRRQEAVALLRDIVLDQPAVEEAVSTVFAAIGPVPATIAGWRLQAIECDPKVCSFQWAREKNGTLASFIAAAQQMSWANPFASGEIATTSMDLAMKPREGDLESLVDSSKFKVALESKLQEVKMIGAEYIISKMEPIEVAMKPLPAPPPGANPVPAPKPLKWKIGQASLSGTQLFLLRSIPEYIDHAGVAMKTLKIDLKTNTWKMEVNYAGN